MMVVGVSWDVFILVDNLILKCWLVARCASHRKLVYALLVLT